MIKVIERKPIFEPKYTIEAQIEVGDGDSFYDNVLTISNEKHWNSWNYISSSEAERIYKFFNKILARVGEHYLPIDHLYALHLYLTGKSQKSSCELYDRLKNEYKCTEKEIECLDDIYSKYSSLLSATTEYYVNKLYNVVIHYYNANGDKYDCEVI